MNKVGLFIGENGNSIFFRDILKDLTNHYAVTVFEPRPYNSPIFHERLNRYAYTRGIRAILGKSDVAFFEWASGLLQLACEIPKRCPIVARMHSFELFAWAGQIDWSKVDRLIVVSNAMRDGFVKQFPAYAARVAVVPNGVRTDVFRPERRGSTLNIGLLASFRPPKRIYESILLLYRLRRDGIPAILHIGGGQESGAEDRRYYAACRNLVQQLGLEPDVKFHGHVDSPADWLRSIDIFLSNSYWEGQQTALLEALASGCYCLAHAWHGAEEVLPADNLYITDDDAVCRITAYAAMSARERHAEQTRMRRIATERFDAALQHERIRDVIESVLNEPLPATRKRSEQQLRERRVDSYAASPAENCGERQKEEVM